MRAVSVQDACQPTQACSAARCDGSDLVELRLCSGVQLARVIAKTLPASRRHNANPNYLVAKTFDEKRGRWRKAHAFPRNRIVRVLPRKLPQALFVLRHSLVDRPPFCR